MGVARRAVMTVLLVCVSCSAPMLPPRGEALIVVDTDMPVPKLVSHVRIDVYLEDITWIASRDIARPRAETWPLSFSVATDATSPRDVLVRLRAYPEGRTRDYRGERFAPKPTPVGGKARFLEASDPVTPFATAACPACPRLRSKDVDVTPSTEPVPLATIDRLVRIHLEPGVVGKAVVLLAGACMGTQADLANARTCVAVEGKLQEPTRERLDPDLRLPTAHIGDFEKPFAQPCAVRERTGRQRAGVPLHDEEVCVIGGAFILGGTEAISASDTDDYPERLAIVPSFLIDKYEYTVGRLRQALDDGYAGDQRFIVNDGPANDPSFGDGAPFACTASTSPMGREQMPLNCLLHQTAKELCRFDGGDLPLEAQWEYVASWAGRSSKNLSLLGSNGLPDCRSVAVARSSRAMSAAGVCVSASGFGVAPVTFGEDQPRGDVAFGVVGLWGNVIERTRDAFASMHSICWLSAPALLPGCAIANTLDTDTLRGSSWRQVLDSPGFASREGASQTAYGTAVGFRCVRGANP